MNDTGSSPPLSDAQDNMRTCIQKVATGPEYSKDLSFEEARDAMATILDGSADPVQAAVYLIALRMKRETQAREPRRVAGDTRR
eukprot:UN18086